MKYVSNYLRSFSSTPKDAAKDQDIQKTQNQPKYFTASQEWIKYLNQNTIDTTESATKAAQSIGQVAAQTVMSTALFDYAAGKIVTAKALGGFVPTFATLSVPAVLTNFAFKIIVNNPTTALACTIGTTLALYPESMSNTFKYTAKTAYNIGKLAYGGVNLGIAAAADTLDYAADKLCDLEEYVCGKPNLIDYSEVTIEQELKFAGNIEQIPV